MAATRPVHPLAVGICGCPLYLDTKLVEHREGCPFPAAAAAADAWNRRFEDRHLPLLGAPVLYWPSGRSGQPERGVTSASAGVRGGTAVVWIEGVAEPVALADVEDATPRWVDARGQHWHPASHDECWQGWLRCEETDRGVRRRAAVEADVGPLVEVRSGTP